MVISPGGFFCGHRTFWCSKAWNGQEANLFFCFTRLDGMKSLPFISILLVVAVSLGAGCTQPKTSADQDAALINPSLETLALTADDAPSGFIVTESRAKTHAEISDFARNLGWQGGWTVRYTGMPDTLMNGTEIVATITVYPPGQMEDIVTFAGAQERSIAGPDATELISPAFGEYRTAFSGITGDDPIVGIIFAKGSHLIVLRMNGDGADYPTLVSLAKSADAKIP